MRRDEQLDDLIRENRELAIKLEVYRQGEASHKERVRTLELQKDELREALRELVQEVEDFWHHHGRFMIGTDEQKPETECECGPDLEIPLALLGKIRPSAERPKDAVLKVADGSAPVSTGLDMATFNESRARIDAIPIDKVIEDVGTPCPRCSYAGGRVYWPCEAHTEKQVEEPRYCVKCGRRLEAADAAHVYTCEGNGNAANPAPFIG